VPLDLTMICTSTKEAGHLAPMTTLYKHGLQQLLVCNQGDAKSRVQLCSWIPGHGFTSEDANLAGCLGLIRPHDKLCCTYDFHKSRVDHRWHHRRKGLLYSREGADWCGPRYMLWAQGPDRGDTLSRSPPGSPSLPLQPACTLVCYSSPHTLQVCSCCSSPSSQQIHKSS